MSFVSTLKMSETIRQRFQLVYVSHDLHAILSHEILDVALSASTQGRRNSFSNFLKLWPPSSLGGGTISGNLKSFEGPVLKCRDSRKRRAFYLNELVIHEIRNNASAIFFSVVVK